MELEPGTRVNGHEIIETIGQGGMGIVYKAKDLELERIVALKMMLPSQEREKQRFLSEAKSAAKLDHPNIVAVHNIGQFQEQPYITMQFVEGESLEDRIKREKVSSQQSAAVVQKIAEALSYAHENSVVHRDVKPANIMIDSSGQPKITDFGLAKRLDDDEGLTLPGHSVGTPKYMAPEQVEGQADPRSDIYSLGVILYKLLTGQAPFEGKNPYEIIKKASNEVPKKPSELAKVDSVLEAICLKAMARNINQRYQKMQTLADDLSAYLSSVENRDSIVANIINSQSELTLDDYRHQEEGSPTPSTASLSSVKSRSNIARPSRIIRPLVDIDKILPRVKAALQATKGQMIDFFSPGLNYEGHALLRWSASDRVFSKKNHKNFIADYRHIYDQLNKRAGSENFWEQDPMEKRILSPPVVTNGKCWLPKKNRPYLEFRPMLLLEGDELESLKSGSLDKKMGLMLSSREIDNRDLAVIDLYDQVLYLGRNVDASELISFPDKPPKGLGVRPHPLPVELRLSLDYMDRVAEDFQAGDDVREVEHYDLMQDDMKGKEYFYFPFWVVPVVSRRTFMAINDEKVKRGFLRKKDYDYLAYEHQASVETRGNLIFSGVWGEFIMAETESSQMVGLRPYSKKYFGQVSISDHKIKELRNEKEMQANREKFIRSLSQ